MGLFSWISDRVSDFVYWVDSKLGVSSSYSGSSLSEAVDIDRELSAFKEEISQEASENESYEIKNVMQSFDTLIEQLRVTYPSDIEFISKRRNSLQKSLEGTFMGYVEKTVSLNDSSFKQILEMQPGDEKKTAIRDRMDEILSSASQDFDSKLKYGVETLHDDLEERLQSSIVEKERVLSKEKEKYLRLQKDLASGTLNIEHLENEKLVLVEIDDYLDFLLRDEAMT